MSEVRSAAESTVRPAMRSAELFSYASPDIRAVSRFLGY